VLDLIGVEEACKQRGIGKALVASYLRGSKAGSFRVTTQASNLESLELYRATGYRYRGLRYSLHWHRPG
jgi:ribosomal protein S18 acetylase RimI-like enzyme